MITQEHLKQNISGIQYRINYATIEGYIMLAENWLVTKIGKASTDYIKALAAESELKKTAQSVLSWYTFVKAIPHLNIRIGDNGMSKNTPQNSLPINKWEYLELLSSSWSNVDVFLEALYNSLEALKPEAWINDPANKARRDLFINNATLMTEYLPVVNNSARLFDACKFHIGFCEREYIKNEITPGVFSGLKAAYKAATEQAPLSQENEELLELIRSALAPLAMLEGLPYFNLAVTPGAITMLERDDLESNVKPKTVAIDNVKRKLTQDSSLALNNLRAFLNETASPTVFPDFYNKYLKPDSDYFSSYDPKMHPII